MTNRPITVGDLIAQLSQYDFSAWVTTETGDPVTRADYMDGHVTITTGLIDDGTPQLIEDGEALRDLRTEWHDKLSEIVSDLHTLKDALGEPE